MQRFDCSCRNASAIYYYEKVSTAILSHIPDASIEIENYSICRKDRNSNGDGILCYIRSQFRCKVISSNDAPALLSCCTEILTIFIDSTLSACIYHPFLNNPSNVEEAICSIAGIVHSFLLSSRINPKKIQIVLCGDFNDIRKQYNRLCATTGLTACVDLPSRGSHLLDQIFVNAKHP